MSTFIVQYTFRSDDEALAIKAEHRDGHRAFVRGLIEQGTGLLIGPFEAEEAPGGLWIVRGDEKAAVRELFDHDPFVANGTVSDITVTRWRAVLGPLAEHL